MRAKGKLRRAGEGFDLSYIQDGDPVFLHAEPSYVSMERRDLLKMTFSLREKTRAFFFCGDTAGEVAVETVGYRLFAKDRIEVALDYRLLFSKNPQTYSLKIKIGIISEEK